MADMIPPTPEPHQSPAGIIVAIIVIIMLLLGAYSWSRGAHQAGVDRSTLPTHTQTPSVYASPSASVSPTP
jgi:hypothetical protein